MLVLDIAFLGVSPADFGFTNASTIFNGNAIAANHYVIMFINDIGYTGRSGGAGELGGVISYNDANLKSSIRDRAGNGIGDVFASSVLAGSGGDNITYDSISPEISSVNVPQAVHAVYDPNDATPDIRRWYIGCYWFLRGW